MTLQHDALPWYKHRWPWLLMAGPGIVVVAGFITAWLAVSTSDGLVTDDYYKEGMAVNQSLERDHQAGALGLHADVMCSGLNVRLVLGAASAMEMPNEITLKLAHPTRAGHDQSVLMVAEGQGVYSGKLDAVLDGKWLASIEDPAGRWRLQGVWHTEKEQALHLQAHAPH